MNPVLLPENSGLAFLGEAAWPPSILPARQAEQLAGAANACGRPNGDVLRRRLAVVNGEANESWQIDFPDHFTAQESALYEQPFTLLQQRAGTCRNPHANPVLRRTLARVSRYLATPAGSSAPEWQWIEDDLLPDASLLVVARDDDFTHGILSSDVFVAWHQAHASNLSPDQLIESFPFPWPSATALSALTATQEEQRHTIARAARSGDAESLNDTVLAAYGWSANLGDGELLEKLAGLNLKRTD